MKYSIRILIVITLLLFVIACGSFNNGDSNTKKNPMIDYEYDSEEGDYFYLIKDYLEQNNIEPKDHHFKKFPVLYYVGDMDSEWEDIVRESVSYFEEYFPMEEVDEESKADLRIKIVDFDTIQRLYPELPDENLTGAGGIKTISPRLVAVVYLLPYAFQNRRISKAVVLHELGHAFGLADHSDDPYDIMFPRAITEYNVESGLIKVNGIEMTIEDANYLSVRDLNTLWKLYNEW